MHPVSIDNELVRHVILRSRGRKVDCPFEVSTFVVAESDATFPIIERTGDEDLRS